MGRRQLIASLGTLAIILVPALAASPAGAQELAAKLTPAQRQIYEDYRRGRDAFEAKLRTYWARVDAKRDARRAKHMRPELSVVYTTGFADGALPDKSNPGYGPLLPKPWRADQLVSLVNRALRW